MKHRIGKEYDKKMRERRMTTSRKGRADYVIGSKKAMAKKNKEKKLPL